MRQIKRNNATDFFPFADENTSDAMLAASGYISALEPRLAKDLGLEGRVQFNIQLRAFNRDEWDRFSRAVDAAFRKISPEGESQ